MSYSAPIYACRAGQAYVIKGFRLDVVGGLHIRSRFHKICTTCTPRTYRELQSKNDLSFNPNSALFKKKNLECFGRFARPSLAD